MMWSTSILVVYLTFNLEARSDIENVELFSSTPDRGRGWWLASLAGVYYMGWLSQKFARVR